MMTSGESEEGMLGAWLDKRATNARNEIWPFGHDVSEDVTELSEPRENERGKRRGGGLNDCSADVNTANAIAKYQVFRPVTSLVQLPGQVDLEQHDGSCTPWGFRNPSSC